MTDKTINYEILASKAFGIIELIEMAEINDTQFKIIRKKLLDLGNDIIRLGQIKEGE
jgi:hypothetical protein